MLEVSRTHTSQYQVIIVALLLPQLPPFLQFSQVDRNEPNSPQRPLAAGVVGVHVGTLPRESVPKWCTWSKQDIADNAFSVSTH